MFIKDERFLVIVFMCCQVIMENQLQDKKKKERKLIESKYIVDIN